MITSLAGGRPSKDESTTKSGMLQSACVWKVKKRQAVGRRGWYATPCGGLGVQRQHPPPLSPGLALRSSGGWFSTSGYQDHKEKRSGESILLGWDLSLAHVHHIRGTERHPGRLAVWLAGTPGAGGHSLQSEAELNLRPS